MDRAIAAGKTVRLAGPVPARVFFVAVMRVFGRDDEAKVACAAAAAPHGPPARVQGVE